MKWLRPDLSENPNQCSDTEPLTSHDMSSPGSETASDSEPHRIESMTVPTDIKRGKVYTFQREWLEHFPWLRYSKAENTMHFHLL